MHLSAFFGYFLSNLEGNMELQTWTFDYNLLQVLSFRKYFLLLIYTFSQD